MTTTRYQSGRFVLDRARAENWLRYAAASYGGDEPPAGVEAPDPAAELPEFGHDWNPVGFEQEAEVYQLVHRAVDARHHRRAGRRLGR